MRQYWTILIAMAAALPCISATADQRFLVIILDGLRPDYVTEEIMPNIHGLAGRGVFFEDNHAVYPTVTRVNSPSIATGSLPGTHGLMGNSIYFPEIDVNAGFTTSDAANLMRVEDVTGGNLLTTISMGEHLQNHGRQLMAVSSGSTGSAFLLNHKARGRGLYHTELTLPASNAPSVSQYFGDPPPENKPNDAQNGRAVDSYLHFGLNGTPPDVTFMWLSDPDKTGHQFGIGHPATLTALRLVDAQVGRILDEHKRRGLTESINIFIASDHGFSTHTGGINIWGTLKRENLDRGVVIVGGAIYVNDGGPERVAAIADTLLGEMWVGAVFAEAKEPGSAKGRYPGTFSFDAIGYAHQRQPDLLVTAAWTSEKNEFGYAGTTAQGGTAGHGTASPFDVHNTLIAAGPAFKSGEPMTVASGNIDIAPTICHVLGLPIPETMDGRVLDEALVDGPQPRYVQWERRKHIARHGNREFVMSLTKVGDTTYLDYAGEMND